MKFLLRQFDIELLAFDLFLDGINGVVCRVLGVEEKHRSLLPLGMEPTDAGLMSWLRSRVIPRNREFVDQILSQYGLDHNNLLGIIKLCLGLSVNDSYWVVPEGFSGKFQDYNLYDNPFENALALVAYTGYGSVRPSAFSSSPEFTTNGNLRKGWRRLKGKVQLFKGGTTGGANTGNEPYSEFYASQVAECMGLNHVSYRLAKWKGTVCSVCDIFTDKEHSFVPVCRWMPLKNLGEVAKALQTLGEEFYQPFCDMMVFDSLVCNTDRHLGNFGLMVENQSNRPCAFAPLFDHGLSLFPFAMREDFKRLELYAQSRSSATGAPFEELTRAFMTERQRNSLHRLFDFHFTQDKNYNLPAWRLRKLEEFLQKRAGQLLKLTER